MIAAFDGTEIPAILNAPSGYAPGDPVALLLHGITTHKDEYAGSWRKLAGELGEVGQASIRIDFRGHGDSQAPLDDYSVRTMLLDVLAAADWLREEQGAGPLRILGASFAAPAAIAASFVLSETVDKLVLVAPVLDFFETFVTPQTPWGRDAWGRDRVTAALRGAPLAIDDGFVLGARFAADLFFVDPVPVLARLGCPVVLMHGDEDGMVPYGVSARVAADLPHVTFVSMERTEHGLAEIGDEDQSSVRSRANYSCAVRELSSGAA